MICYAFPLANEASLILGRCEEKESFVLGSIPCTLAKFRGRDVLVAQIGMGQENAFKSTEVLLTHFRINILILAGYGGALVPQLRLGQVVIASNFSTKTVIPFVRLLNGFSFVNFYSSTSVIATRADRERLAKETESQVVEMETQAVARLVHDRGIPFLAVRCISDELSDDLPVHALAAGYDAQTSQVTPFRLILRLLFHPWEIGRFAKFVRGLPIARTSLTAFLEQLSDELPSSL